MTCTVICPVYREILPLPEVIAIKNNATKLAQYNFVLLVPANFDLAFYEQFDEQHNLNLIKISPHHFRSIKSYNNYLMSSEFWHLFESDYVLICQDDAWIFSDELEYWMSLNLDYIGAPWFKGFLHATADSKIIKVGNGGLSLRSTQGTLKALENFSWLNCLFYAFLRLDHLKIFYILKYLLSPKGLNEDKFFSYLLEYLPDYKIASIEQALKFSFEINAPQLFKANNNQLPFGCHGWNKYSISFWKEHIPELRDIQK